MSLVKQGIPKLKSLLRKTANKDKVFPLFPPKTEKLIWSNTNKNHEREAAILVPLVTYEGQPSLLFTIRSSNLPTHASEVSFPGGHYDESLGDDSLQTTAIREAQEELLADDDYPWDEVEILGKASSLPSIRGIPVTPVIAVFPQEIFDNDRHNNNTFPFPGSPSEVDEVFCISLQELIDVETTERSKRFQSDIPAFPTKCGKKIWGLTAIVTRPLLHKLFKPVFLTNEHH